MDVEAESEESPIVKIPRVSFEVQVEARGIRVFTIYQVLLGWKTCKYYYDTDELSNLRPTQPKKTRLKAASGPLFPTDFFCFRGFGLVLFRKQTARNLT